MSNVWGGAEQLLAHLIQSTAARGHEAGMIARRAGPMSQWAQNLALGRRVDLPRRGRSPRQLWALRKWLRSQEFDLIVLNDPDAITSIGLAAWGLTMPRVGMRHTAFPLHSRWKHTHLVDHLVCVSNAAQKECLKAQIPRSSTTVINCGLPAPRVEPAAVRQVRDMFAQASHGKAPRHLLALGRLLALKGFDATIAAVARGVQQGKNWRLWLAGEGPEMAALKSLAGDLGVLDRVHLLGFRTDVHALLAAADVFVSASHSEGLPLVLVEAMLAACPMVSTPVGGCAEALQVDESGQSPFAEIFLPGDVSGLAAAITRVIEGPTERRHRAEAARRWAAENYSVPRMTERHLALYDQLVSSARGEVSRTDRRIAA
jgi:glycosyltransferase involved in cell wall biosynthesis